MSNQEAPFSFTTKIGGVDLFTVRGGTYDEFLSNLVLASNVPTIGGLAKMLETGVPQTTEDAVGNVINTFGSVTVTADSFPPVKPVAAGDRTCAHGTMVKRKGNGAKGEWRAFFCCTPQGTPNQCQAIFAKKGTPEWDNF